MEENVILENRIPLTKRSQISAAKPKRPEVEMKYQFHSLVNSPLIYEGELSRHVER
jgi:hypothetical protein